MALNSKSSVTPMDSYTYKEAVALLVALNLSHHEEYFYWFIKSVSSRKVNG